MKCFNCGAELSDDTKFCSYCGEKMPEQPTKKEEPVEDPIPETDIEPEYEETPKAQSMNKGNQATPTKPTLGDKAKSKFREFWNKLSLFGKLSTVSIAASVLLGIIAFLAGRVFAGIIAIVWLAVVVVALLMKKDVIKVPKTWIPILSVLPWCPLA